MVVKTVDFLHLHAYPCETMIRPCACTYTVLYTRMGMCQSSQCMCVSRVCYVCARKCKHMSLCVCALANVRRNAHNARTRTLSHKHEQKPLVLQGPCCHRLSLPRHPCHAALLCPAALLCSLLWDQDAAHEQKCGWDKTCGRKSPAVVEFDSRHSISCRPVKRQRQGAFIHGLPHKSMHRHAPEHPQMS